jgi:two-component system sensor histidine kinase PhoQ
MIHRLSIIQRSLLAITISLICFLGIAGWVLDQAFRDSAAQGEQQRLESTLYGLLAVTDITPEGKLSIPNFLTDERFNRPNSGLYAIITNEHGVRLWQSRSAIGEKLPDINQQDVGERKFQQLPDSRYFSYSAGIAWESGNLPPTLLTVHILSAPDFFLQQVRQFRRSLLSWFIALALIVGFAQIIVLRWSLSPLQQVTRDLHALESGEKQLLSTAYPMELKGLTQNINHLLDIRQQQLGRYRHALDDLAHSLKTPLAVLRGLDSSESASSKQIIDEQINRMTRIVDYHLQRAATAGKSRIKSNTPVRKLAERLVHSLSKVYSQKQVHYDISIENDLAIAMDENDLMELLGNLLDNASKWCTHHVRVVATSKHPDLILQIDDDGPGIADAKLSEVLERGKRADQTTDGQGIGLAIVTNISHAYDGKVEISRSNLGGASVKLTFPLTTQTGKMLP